MIIGGGFAGLAAALRFGRSAGFRRDYNVTLVDQNCYHLYHGLLYEVATADLEIREEDLQYLHGGVCIRLKSLGALVMKSQIDFVQAKVTGLDRNRRAIQLEGQPEIRYDALLIGLGSEPSYFNVPGLREHALTLMTIPDALVIRERLETLLASAKQNQPRRILIGGGGVTGVELAGEILATIRHREAEGRIDSKSVEVMIVEAGSGVLSSLGPVLSQRAQHRLEQLGARFMFQQPITMADDHQVSLKNGIVITYDLLLWTGGVTGNGLVHSLGLPISGRGQLAVESTLRVQGTDEIWAAGDCAGWIDPASKKTLPLTAPIAIAEGRHAAGNIMRSFRKTSATPFVPDHAGFVIPIGGRFALAKTKFGTFSGWLAWAIRKFVDLNYFSTIMNFRNALKVFLRGARVYLKID